MSDLYNLSIEEQVRAEQVKAAQTQQLVAVMALVAALIVERIKKQTGELSEKPWSYRRRWLSSAKNGISKEIDKGVKAYLDELEDTAGAFSEFEALGMAALLDRAIKPISKTVAFRAAADLPMSSGGQLLKDFVNNFTVVETNRILGVLRTSLTQGRTNQEIIQNIQGTRRLRFRDGIITSSKRNAQAMVETATQHAVSVSRVEVWKTNGFNKYEWVSVLDGNTTTQCRSLDGRIFEIGQGPVPPIHYRCRSTIYLLDSANDTVTGDQDYYDWLKGRSARFQDSVLGPTRGKLLRDGGLSATEFADLNLSKSFQPLTLDEMRAEAPEAFKRAEI